MLTNQPEVVQPWENYYGQPATLLCDPKQHLFLRIRVPYFQLPSTPAHASDYVDDIK